MIATQKSGRHDGWGALSSVNALFRFGSIHPSPDSGWQMEACRLYAQATPVSVQYSTHLQINKLKHSDFGFIPPAVKRRQELEIVHK
jgi:hypothetical protein